MTNKTTFIADIMTLYHKYPAAEVNGNSYMPSVHIANDYDEETKENHKHLKLRVPKAFINGLEYLFSFLKETLYLAQLEDINMDEVYSKLRDYRS